MLLQEASVSFLLPSDGRRMTGDHEATASVEEVVRETVSVSAHCRPSLGKRVIGDAMDTWLDLSRMNFDQGIGLVHHHSNCHFV